MNSIAPPFQRPPQRSLKATPLVRRSLIPGQASIPGGAAAHTGQPDAGFLIAAKLHKRCRKPKKETDIR